MDYWRIKLTQLPTKLKLKLSLKLSLTITAANNSRMGENVVILTKHFLNTKKFPHTASAPHPLQQPTPSYSAPLSSISVLPFGDPRDFISGSDVMNTSWSVQ